MAQRRSVRYLGRVQGVGFRANAAHIARRFAVTGYVRNLPDGGVELVAEGEAEELNGFLGSVSQSMQRNIRGQDVSHLAATGEFEDFSIQG